MGAEATELDGLLVLRGQTRTDDRGFFRETHRRSELAEALGASPVFVQTNHARSMPGVLRGFHAEPWDKLVYVTSGRVLAAFADLRPASATFGQHVTVELGDATGRPAVFVPEGIGNAYCVVGDEPADYVYQVTAEWDAEADKGAVAWNDPTLAVAWPVQEPVLSEADRAAPTLRERFSNHPMFAGSS